MFVVRDADTTVYIFGTFHALDGHSQWFGERVGTPSNSRTSWCWKRWFPNSQRRRCCCLRRRSSRRQVTPSASFLATTRMAINAGRSQGMQVDNGADMVLRRAAEAQGKPVEGLETLQSQLDMFYRLPSSAVAAKPAAPAPRPGQPVVMNANPMQSLSKAMSDMQSAWKRGDQTVFVQHARPARKPVARHLPDDVHGAEYALGGLDQSADANSGHRIRCGRRGASRGQGQPARAACRARHRVSAGQLTAPMPCFCETPCTRARAPGHGHPWRRGAGF